MKYVPDLRFCTAVRITDETAVMDEGISDVLRPLQTLVFAELDRFEEFLNEARFAAFHVDRRRAPTSCDFAGSMLGPLDLRVSRPLSFVPELEREFHLVQCVSSEETARHGLLHLPQCTPTRELPWVAHPIQECCFRSREREYHRFAK